jgi:gamma-glutamyl hydrolase
MKTFIVVFLCLLGVLSTLARAQSDSDVNTWPIVGVFTQPSSSTQGSCGGDCLYLAASYVKFIEAAGARVVPINYYASKEELDNLFTSLNGFLFVGGGSAYPPSAQHIFDKTIEANDNGDYSPLFGVCMGFQWTFLAAANNEVSLDPSDGTQMDAENISLALDFTGAEKQSKFFKDAPQSIMDILGKENVTMNNHHYGVYPSSYDSTPAWKNFFNVRFILLHYCFSFLFLFVMSLSLSYPSSAPCLLL